MLSPNFKSLNDLFLKCIGKEKAVEALTQPELDRRLAIARIFSKSVSILGTEEKAVRWLQSRPPVFMGKTPLESLETALGIQQVETALGRIESGVYA